MIEINRNPSVRELRVFALLFALFFGAIGGAVYHKTSSLSMPAILWSVGIGVSALGALVPPLLRWVYIGMTYAAFPIGWVISHMLLAAIFYGVLTPVGLILRLFRYDPLQRKRDTSKKTYWTPHNPADKIEQYFRQF